MTSINICVCHKSCLSICQPYAKPIMWLILNNQPTFPPNLVFLIIYSRTERGRRHLLKEPHQHWWITKLTKLAWFLFGQLFCVKHRFRSHKRNRDRTYNQFVLFTSRLFKVHFSPQRLLALWLVIIGSNFRKCQCQSVPFLLFIFTPKLYRIPLLIFPEWQQIRVISLSLDAAQRRYHLHFRALLFFAYPLKL